MRNTILISILFLLLTGCNTPNGSDCFQTAGTIVKEQATVPFFDKILVNPGVELILKEGSPQEVTIETGKNLMPDIVLTVNENKLEISDTNQCNLIRDYEITKVYITSPNITEIRSSSEYPVRSDGLLTYPSLSLIAENFLNDYLNSGDFYMDLNITNLSIIANGSSIFYLSGMADSMDINFAGANPRFEGQDLKINRVNLFARSSNDILVQPIDEIKGKILSIGNVILFNTPPIIEVEELYTGKLIIN